MKVFKLALGAAALVSVFALPAMAQQAAVVTSGTGVAVTSGTGVAVSPGTRMVLLPGSTVRNGAVVANETITVSDANTAVMGAPAGSVVTVTRYAGPVPGPSGYLSRDYQRYLALGK
jgi:hypothetical protein